MRQTLRALVGVGLLSFAPTASAQTGTTLSGAITQTQNSQPLGGALVLIEELHVEVRTNQDGTYTFADVRPGQYHVAVRADGYSTKRTEVKIETTPQTLNVSMALDLHFAEVLSVSPTARPQFESYQPTTVVDGEELMR